MKPNIKLILFAIAAIALWVLPSVAAATSIAMHPGELLLEIDECAGCDESLVIELSYLGGTTNGTTTRLDFTAPLLVNDIFGGLFEPSFEMEFVGATVIGGCGAGSDIFSGGGMSFCGSPGGVFVGRSDPPADGDVDILFGNEIPGVDTPFFIELLGVPSSMFVRYDPLAEFSTAAPVVQRADFSVVPEPTAALLFGAGTVVFSRFRRRA